MRVISWNLLHASPVLPGQSPRELDEIFGEIKVDLLALQEVDENQPRSQGAAHIAKIAEIVGASDWAYARTLIGTPGEKWRSARGDETDLHSACREPSYGIGLISKIPVTKWHRIELGRSIVGLPLLVGGEKRPKFMYVNDEPRVAIIAELTNGYTVAVTHLSFFPVVNYLQLRKLQRVLKKLPGRKIIMGDLNLPFAIPERATRWHSLVACNSYPSWKPAIQFDYILTEEKFSGTTIELAPMAISDHLPIGFHFD